MTEREWPSFRDGSDEQRPKAPQSGGNGTALTGTTEQQTPSVAMTPDEEAWHAWNRNAGRDSLRRYEARSAYDRIAAQAQAAQRTTARPAGAPQQQPRPQLTRTAWPERLPGARKTGGTGERQDDRARIHPGKLIVQESSRKRPA